MRSTKNTEPGTQYLVRKMSAMRGTGFKGVVGLRETMDLSFLDTDVCMVLLLSLKMTVERGSWLSRYWPSSQCNLRKSRVMIVIIHLMVVHKMFDQRVMRLYVRCTPYFETLEVGVDAIGGTRRVQRCSINYFNPNPSGEVGEESAARISPDKAQQGSILKRHDVGSPVTKVSKNQ